MSDIFMESSRGALLQFDALISVDPAVGAVSACAVVILTMLGASSFDPRLMRDATQST